MLRKRIAMALCILLSITTITGCGGDKEDSSKNENSTASYLKDMKAGEFYVLHGNADGTVSCDQVYFGAATFDKGDAVDSYNDKRVMWFKEDFSKIPTLYAGDQLVMYSNDVFKESFRFERFEDYGYTIGFCGLKATESNRYSVSTDPDERCTYPEGDTDVILTYSSSSVIIDKIGGKEIRNEDKSPTSNGLNTDWVTRSGTIRGLTQDAIFETDIYEGTVLHPGLKFKADVKAMGSCEVVKSTNFSFEEQNNIITLEIPGDFNTGYYCIEGMGMFRYIKGDSYSASTNFNVPNKIQTENPDGITVMSSFTGESINSDTGEDEYSSGDIASNDIATQTFAVTSPGNISLRVDFELDGSYDESSLPVVTAIIDKPNGTQEKLINDGNGMSVNFMAEEGEYVITYYDLGPRTPILSTNNGDSQGN